MKTVTRIILIWPAAFLLIFSLAACGVKGPVKPPLSRSPSAAKGLATRQIGDHLQIFWTIPKTNQDGSPLELQGFEVFRNAFAAGSACPECGQPGIPYLSVDLEYLQDVQRSGDRLLVEETSLAPGSGYFYKVVPVDTKGIRGAPATISTLFHPPPLPPRQPIVKRETRGIHLNWSPSGNEIAAAGFLGYNIYRREKDEPPPSAPINEEYLIDTTFLDVQAVPEKAASYLYTLRSVWRMGNQLLESADSPPATASE